MSSLLDTIDGFEKIPAHTTWLNPLTDPDGMAEELRKLREGTLPKERLLGIPGFYYGQKDTFPAVEFDTLVGTGVSGMIPLLYVAKALNVNWLAVRKVGELTHTGSTVEGELGRKWLFLDDFIDTGKTLAHVKRTIDISREAGFISKFQGVFQYYSSTPYLRPTDYRIKRIGIANHVSFTD